MKITISKAQWEFIGRKANWGGLKGEPSLVHPDFYDKGGLIDEKEQARNNNDCEAVVMALASSNSPEEAFKNLYKVYYTEGNEFGKYLWNYLVVTSKMKGINLDEIASEGGSFEADYNPEQLNTIYGIAEEVKSNIETIKDFYIENII